MPAPLGMPVHTQEFPATAVSMSTGLASSCSGNRLSQVSTVLAVVELLKCRIKQHHRHDLVYRNFVNAVGIPVIAQEIITSRESCQKCQDNKYHSFEFHSASELKGCTDVEQIAPGVRGSKIVDPKGTRSP